MPASDAPLGVFDSGLGGLTVVHALRVALPAEHVVYLGDTARVPYGTRSAETVVRYARACAEQLVGRGVKALVIACNTVSAVALELLRAELDMPVIGVIDPGAQAAVRAAERLAEGSLAGGSAGIRLGVLGTIGTIASGAYPRAVARVSTRWEVIGEPAPLLVPLVEEGWLDGPVPELAVERYVAPLIAGGARVLVLGCTHYPLLKGTIARVAERLAGFTVPVVDSAEATAALVTHAFAEGRIAPRVSREAGRLQLLVTDRPSSFAAQAERFLGEGAVPEVEQVDLAP